MQERLLQQMHSLLGGRSAIVGLPGRQKHGIAFGWLTATGCTAHSIT